MCTNDNGLLTINNLIKIYIYIYPLMEDEKLYYTQPESLSYLIITIFLNNGKTSFVVCILFKNIISASADFIKLTLLF